MLAVQKKDSIESKLTPEEYLSRFAYIYASARYYSCDSCRYFTPKEIALNASVMTKQRVTEANVEGNLMAGIIEAYNDFTFLWRCHTLCLP